MSEKIMKCKCLEIIKDKLTKHHGEGSDVQLDLKQAINMKSLDFSLELPPLYYSYTKGGKRKKSYVIFDFCPFCGKSNSLLEFNS